MKRARFLGTAAALSAAAAAPARSLAQLPVNSVRAGRKALVLSGGGNRGAYEAGAIVALADKAGLRDGQPLDYDLVCGTSIGALNSYLIATARYSQLRTIWSIIPQLNVTRLKPPYNKIKEPSAGVLSRLWAALDLGLSLTKDEKGVLDPSGVNQVLTDIVQPSDSVHIPLYVATTNLTRMRGEIFVRRATTPAGMAKQAVNDRITGGYRLSVVRTATDDIVRNMLFASAAIPIAFEPVLLPSIDDRGVNDAFVDGGVTENVPVDLARLCAHDIDVMLVDPPNPHPEVMVRNAAEVAGIVFQTMQRRILEYQVQLAFAESFAMANAGSNAIVDDIALNVRVIRPDRDNPGQFADFSNAEAIREMYDRGYADVQAKGWSEFHMPSLHEVLH
jgi:predicted acylesterase/phospholipase RssA